MEGDDAANTGSAGELAGLAGGEMGALGGPLGLGVEEGRLDEEIVRSLGEGDDLRGILRRIAGIGDIADLLPGADPHHLFFQLPEKTLPCSGDDAGVVRRSPHDRPLQLLEPGTDLQPQLRQPVLHDVDMPLLFKGESEAGDLVVKVGNANAQPGLVMEEIVGKGAGPESFDRKATLTMEFRAETTAIGMNLTGKDGEVGVVVVDEVPAVGGETMADLGDETGGAIEVELLLPAEAEAKEMIEADEVVDVGVGDEDMAGAQELARREGVEGAEIEEEGAAAEEEVDEDPGIVEGGVDQKGVKDRGHARPGRGKRYRGRCSAPCGVKRLAKRMNSCTGKAGRGGRG